MLIGANSMTTIPNQFSERSGVQLKEAQGVGFRVREGVSVGGYLAYGRLFSDETMGPLASITQPLGPS